MSTIPSTARAGFPLTALVTVLTVGTGAVDVASFSRLGGVFSSVMTGNLVVFGYAVSDLSADLLLSTAVAIAAYAAGVLCGTGIAGRPRPDTPLWPRRVTLTLVVELVVLCGFAAGWVSAHSHLTSGVRVVLLVLASLAMGLQSAAMRGLGGRVAISTTYLTGTLTGVLSALLSPGRRPRTDLRGVAILVAVTAGAAAGALLIATVPAALPAVPLAALVAVITTVALHHRPVRRAAPPSRRT